MTPEEFDRHEHLYSIAEVSSMLHLKMEDGRNVGRNILFKILKYNKVLMKDNRFYPFWVDMGLGVHQIATKNFKTYVVPMFTQTGLNYLSNGFMSGRYSVEVEQNDPVIKIEPF
jgi:phage antirepressor YoqD-like protein